MLIRYGDNIPAYETGVLLKDRYCSPRVRHPSENLQKNERLLSTNFEQDVRALLRVPTEVGFLLRLSQQS